MLVVLFWLSSCLANFSYFSLFLRLHSINYSLNTFLNNFLFYLWLWHLIFKCHEWHFNELLISFLLGDRRHFFLNFFLLNFGWPQFRHFLLLNFSLLVALSSFSFVKFIVYITVFFLFVFLIFCFLYCYIGFLNLFRLKRLLIYHDTLCWLLGQRHLVLVHVVSEQTWVKDWPSVITLNVKLRNLIRVLIIYWNSTRCQ